MLDKFAVPDAVHTNEDTALPFIDVLANDGGPKNLKARQVVGLETSATLGMAAVLPDGSGVSYDPRGAFDHLGVGESAQDTFTYTVQVSRAPISSATVTVTIDGVNDPPQASNDFGVVTDEDNFLAIDVNTLLSNDTDVDGDVLHISSVDRHSQQGADVFLGEDGYVNYAAFFSPQLQALVAGETLTDTFSYVVSDGNGGTDIGEVTVTVVGLNDPLFTARSDVIDFNDIRAGTYIEGTQYDALEGDDIVILPADQAAAIAAGFDPAAPFIGGSGFDRITGGSLNETIYGSGGNAILDFGDQIFGGLGNDNLYGSEFGNALVVGDLASLATDQLGGDDSITGMRHPFGPAGANTNTLYGDAIDLFGRGGDDTVRGGGGNDEVFGDALVIHQGGSGGNDVVSDGVNAVFVGIQDTVVGDANIIMAGGRGGDDTLIDDTPTSLELGTILIGDARHLFGIGGNDHLFGGIAYGDANTLGPGSQGGDDVLAESVPSGVNPALAFGDGRTLQQGAIGGNDTLMGGSDFAYGDGEVFEPGVLGGDDTLFVSGGLIYGDAAQLAEGAVGGEDLFVMSSESRGTIMDFEKGKDLLSLSGDLDFTTLDSNGSGTLGDGDELARSDGGDTTLAFNGFGSGLPSVTIVGVTDLTAADFATVSTWARATATRQAAASGLEVRLAQPLALSRHEQANTHDKGRLAFEKRRVGRIKRLGAAAQESGRSDHFSTD